MTSVHASFSSDQHLSGLLLTFALLSLHREAPNQTGQSEVHYLVALGLVLNLIRPTGLCTGHRVQRLISRFKSILFETRGDQSHALVRSRKRIRLVCADPLLKMIKKRQIVFSNKEMSFTVDSGEIFLNCYCYAY